MVARLGGEEFGLLLPEAALDSAVRAADRLRARIADTPFMVAGAPIRLTVSIGVAEADARKEDVAALMKATDAALYQAKDAGRNRVCPAPADGVVSLALAS